VVGQILERVDFLLLEPGALFQVQQVVLHFDQLGPGPCQISTNFAAAEAAEAFGDQPRR
jgi:hypothetical protein